jgi:hypothetical protein
VSNKHAYQRRWVPLALGIWIAFVGVVVSILAVVYLDLDGAEAVGVLLFLWLGLALAMTSVVLRSRTDWTESDEVRLRRIVSGITKWLVAMLAAAAAVAIVVLLVSNN